MSICDELPSALIDKDRLLDVISLSTLEWVTSIDLETPEGRGPTDIATSSKTPMRIAPFWQWRSVHVAKRDEVRRFYYSSHKTDEDVQATVLLIEGVPWQCGMPSPNGEVTRVIMLNVDPKEGLELLARLELPGEGHVGICRSDTC